VRGSELTKAAGVLSFGKELLKQVERNGWIESYPYGPYSDAYCLTEQGRQSLVGSH
jgi:DNA-binding HxlR family transcriptional regulator